MAGLLSMGERERLDDRLPDRREGRHIFFVPLLLASLIFACAVGLSRVVCPPPNRRWRLAEGSPGTTRTQQSLKIVSPVNRDHVPSLTSTADCAGDVSRPVLAGADVVEYFNIPAGSEPVIGKGSISTLHNGYLFFFNSTENRGLFEAHPHNYLPAWGGFCSYGIAAEEVWTRENLGPFADPSSWIIGSDRRLHVFRSLAPKAKFEASLAEYLREGEKRWNVWFTGQDGPMNTGCICASDMCDDN